MARTHYDVIIVGAGPAGIFTALRYRERWPNRSLLLLEKGRPIEKRLCFKREGKSCQHCVPCNITTGFSGAGAYSDGKLSLSPFIGGDLVELCDVSVVQEAIRRVDEIYVRYGADTRIYGIDFPDRIEKIRARAIRSHIQLVENPLRHLGTEKSAEIYARLQNQLLHEGVEIRFECPVKDLVVVDGRVAGVVADQVYSSETVVLAVGREGSAWLSSMIRQYQIAYEVGPVDIGVRVEVRNEIMKEINDTMYEGKFIYYTPTFDDKVRTFCQNPGGVVATESYEGNIAVVNGHSYKSEGLKTDNTNFAILVSHAFTRPFNQPVEYGKYLAGLGNMLSGNRIIVQRFGDLRRGRRTTPERLSRGNLKPTLLDALPGDLSLVLPYRTMTDIIEMLLALDHVAPGVASSETLLYGVEVKFYSQRILVQNFQTSLPGLYAIGDGAGWTRGLMQASVSGYLLGGLLE
ncbi:MAG: FAD-binding protein [Brevinematales bacterium]|nr:FAD-binding protein [Brevinematales bacterium]